VSDKDVLARLQTLIATSTSLAGDSVAEQLSAAQAKIAQLEVAVEHRTVIGQAVGILIERYHVDADTAFDALTRVSSQTNRKVYDIAQELAATGRSEGFADRDSQLRPPAS
jgi:AmiR/NasT family two-component response regulator